MRFLDALLADEHGATAIEYGLLATVVAVVAVGAIVLVGSEVNASYTDTQAKIIEAKSS